MNSYKIVIPNWHPVSVNKLLSANRFVASRLKKRDYKTVQQHLEQQRVPRVAIPRTFARDARKHKIDLDAIDHPYKGLAPIRRGLEVEVVLGPFKRGEKGAFAKGKQQRTHFYDNDNLNKAIRDALVDGGWLVDDRPKWLEAKEPRQRRGTIACTIIYLEDLA